MVAKELSAWSELDELLFQMGKGIHRTTPLDSKGSQVPVKPIKRDNQSEAPIDLQTSIQMGDMHGEVRRQEC